MGNYANLKNSNEEINDFSTDTKYISKINKYLKKINLKSILHFNIII